MPPRTIRLDMPVRGTGFTLRFNRWRRPEYAEFPSADGRIWLFRDQSGLDAFLASETWPAPYWRELLAQSEDVDEIQQTCHLDLPRRFNLWQTVDGTLRWNSRPAYECGELCLDLAFACDAPHLLDLLGPELRTTDPEAWRRIMAIVVPLFRVWGEPDEPATRDIVAAAIAGAFAGPFRDGSYA